jgi:hypothetical protein
MSTAVSIWAYLWLAIVVVLTAVAPRIGKRRVAPWLVIIGLFLFSVEEPLLTFWLVLSDPRIDHDGMATLITGQARAHVFDASAVSAASLVLLGWIAMTAFRRGERWARRVLVVGWVFVAATVLTTTVFVFSRGLPVPGPGGIEGEAGFGWKPLAVALLAWAIGVVLGSAAPSEAAV